MFAADSQIKKKVATDSLIKSANAHPLPLKGKSHAHTLAVLSLGNQRVAMAEFNLKKTSIHFR